MTQDNLSDRMRAVRGTQVSAFEYSDMTAQAVELEQHAARASLQVSEPVTYSKRSPHSFFADIARVRTRLGDTQGAGGRLDRHQDELALAYPAWRETRRRQASAAYEAVFAGDRRGAELLDRMDRLGLARFRTDDAFEKSILEQRGASTAQGAGGYFAPPLWLLDEYAQAARAGRPFADLWHSIPLPPGCSSINVPKWLTGVGAGPATDGASAPSDSPADAYATSKVATIAGTQLVSMQWAEQTAPPGADVFIFNDLMADIGSGLDVQLLIGSGAAGQLTGIIPAGTAAAASLVTVANSNAVTGQTLTVASAGSPVYRTAARMLSLLTRARGLAPSHVLIHPSTWFQLTGTIDSTGRPLVPLDATPPEGGPAMVNAWGRTCLLDDNMPITFGGTTAPAVSASGGGITEVTPGNGTWAVIAAVRASDLYLFEGEMRVQVAMDIPESGTGQWRYTAHQYTASLRDRYSAAATLSAAAETDTGSVTAGGATAAGVATHYQANSPLQPALNGF